MRKDIQIHIKTGDVAIDPQNTFKLRDFRWLEKDSTGKIDGESVLSRYVYGEIDVPYAISNRTILENGVYLNIPYTPVYQEFMVRIRRVNEDGDFVYIQNDTNGSIWFLVQSPLYGGELKNVFVSTLPTISEDNFFILIRNGIAQLYSASQSDFNIVKAGRQNANCLLACFPGGNYRYPLTGVGLARWINSNNVASGTLSQTLQDEFSADGVTINNAAFNYDTKQMELDGKDLDV